jgi:hypothetical protein
MRSLEGRCRRKSLRPSYVAGPECGAKGGHPRFLCAASSISPWRLRELEVHCANSEGSLVTRNLRKRHVGWRDPPRVRASSGRNRGPRALEFQWFRQHGFGFAARETRDSSAHRHGVMASTSTRIGIVGAAGKERKVNYAEEENNHGGSAISHYRHGDGSGGHGHVAHVQGAERISRQGRVDDHRGVCARAGQTLSIDTMHMDLFTCWKAPS